MKKLLVFILAALLLVVFTLPAAAMEHQFSGYWRTRFYTNQGFSGDEDRIRADAQWGAKGDYTIVDTRTRLWYTAIFHENLKFVNGFEFDGTWGSHEGSRAAGAPSNKGFARLGADGANIEIKHSFVDFTLGSVNAKVGIQPFTLARGFLISDDVPGAIVGYVGDNISVPFIWIRAYEGNNPNGLSNFENNALDVDFFGLAPKFSFGGVSINPYVLYAYSDNARDWSRTLLGAALPLDDLNLFYAGLDVDMNFDPVSIWLTAIYQGGDVSVENANDIDFEGWLGALGFSFDIGMGDIHGQAFYATGDDNADNTVDTFINPAGVGNLFAGQSYYWAEIMGYGIFDYMVSFNAPGDKISNIMAANLGATIKPMDKLSITIDAWWAALAEDVVIAGQEENELGIEVDLTLTYQLVQGLKIDLVGAYLFAGDVTTMGARDAADPWELGTRLSLSF